MKKTYQNPEIKIVKIETTQMIAASEQMGFGTSVTTATSADSRQSYDFWYDEEEDEY